MTTEDQATEDQDSASRPLGEAEAKESKKLVTFSLVKHIAYHTIHHPILTRAAAFRVKSRCPIHPSALPRRKTKRYRHNRIAPPPDPPCPCLAAFSRAHMRNPSSRSLSTMIPYPHHSTPTCISVCAPTMPPCCAPNFPIVISSSRSDIPMPLSSMSVSCCDI